jgi:hypothetical protein
MTGVDELVITEEEGDDFMAAAQKMARHYSVETTQKTLDTVAFAGMAAQVYGTRLVAYFARRRQERQAAWRRLGPVRRNAGRPGGLQGAPVTDLANGHDLGLHIIPEGDGGYA